MLPAQPSGQGRHDGAGTNPHPPPPAPSRGNDLERPLGETPVRPGSEEDAAPRPGFGRLTTHRLRSTEKRLARALERRETRPLKNSLDSRSALVPPAVASGLRLGAVFPFAGMKGKIEAIIATYNAKFPGLEARMFNSMDDAVRTASTSLVRPGQTLRGIAVEQGVHAYAVEFRCHRDEGISLIVLDSGAYPTGVAESLRDPRRNPDRRIDSALLCGLGVQRDTSSCAGFAKDFLKEFHREGAAFERLHRDTRAWLRRPDSAQAMGLLPGAVPYPSDRSLLYLDAETAGKLLPLPLFKNVQSTHRLKQIADLRPETLTQAINTRQPPGGGTAGETIPERLQRLTGREWLSPDAVSGSPVRHDVPESDKVVPMAENYRRMHGKAAAFGSTGEVKPGRNSPTVAPGFPPPPPGN